MFRPTLLQLRQVCYDSEILIYHFIRDNYDYNVLNGLDDNNVNESPKLMTA